MKKRKVPTDVYAGGMKEKCTNFGRKCTFTARVSRRGGGGINSSCDEFGLYSMLLLLLYLMQVNALHTPMKLQ